MKKLRRKGLDAPSAAGFMNYSEGSMLESINSSESTESGIIDTLEPELVIELS